MNPQVIKDITLLSQAAFKPAPPMLTRCTVCGGWHAHRCDK